MARTAEKMEPSRRGYHLLTGQILLRMGRPAEAAANAAYVSQPLEGVDHDESHGTLGIVCHRATARRSSFDPPPGESLSAEGTVKSVSCDPTLSASRSTRPDTPSRSRSKAEPGDFPTRLMVRSDHFTPCFHMTGLRAVVRYKLGVDKSSTGDVVKLGLPR